ncbi:MAG: hypothetical protein ABMA13_09320 [Chthoniobacteraceae bacterium]
MPEIINPTKSTEPTPEQLLKLLEMQIATKRARRRTTPRHRAAVVATALLLIVLGAVAALLILQQTVAEMPRGNRADAPPTAALDSQ